MFGRHSILLVLLLTMVAFVTMSEERAGAEDVAQTVEGENLDRPTTGTSIVSNPTLYSGGKALRFSNNTAIVKKQVNFTRRGDVVLMARATQSGGSPKLRVSVNGTFSIRFSSLIRWQRRASPTKTST